ncbi:MAG: hypothetical protein H7831_09935 [Magnetococcus sp. WYHC-3]
MRWFKFYGQDFLTDPKMRALSIFEKQCWVVLLCLANAEDKDGEVRHVLESEVMHQADIEFDSPFWHSTIGFLKKFEKLEMIQIKEVDEATDRYHLTLTHYKERQGKDLTGYERVKKYRQKHGKEDNDNEMITSDDNAVITPNRVDKSRVDKNRIDKKRVEVTSLSFDKLKLTNKFDTEDLGILEVLYGMGFKCKSGGESELSKWLDELYKEYPIDHSKEIVKFKEYYEGKGKKIATHKLAWRNWLANSIRFKNKNNA